MGGECALIDERTLQPQSMYVYPLGPRGSVVLGGARRHGAGGTEAEAASGDGGSGAGGVERGRCGHGDSEGRRLRGAAA